MGSYLPSIGNEAGFVQGQKSELSLRLINFLAETGNMSGLLDRVIEAPILRTMMVDCFCRID